MKTFLLGVGAQKSGTTWLWDYINKRNDCDMGFTKEYETFTYTDVGNLGHFLLHRKEVVDSLNRKEKLDKKDLAFFKLMTFYCDEEEYFKYFNSILKEDGILLSGDISPSYAQLPKHTLNRIKNKLSRLGIKVKVVFIMRDPVERNISASKLYLSKKSEKIVDQLSSDDFNQMLSVNCKNAINEYTTRYNTTIETIESVFASEDILYVFYEDLFDPNKMAGETERICNFLNIPYIQPNSDKVNASKDLPFEVYQSTRKIIYDYYKPVYDFIEDKFGRMPWTRYD